MYDFVKITSRSPKHGLVEVYPEFLVETSDDLMIKGGDFYAVWMEDKQLWSTNEDDVIRTIDAAIKDEVERLRKTSSDHVKGLYLKYSSTRMIKSWHSFVQTDMREHFTPLDKKIIFADTKTTKKDYASKKLPYSLSDGECPCWDELVGTLYSETERAKIEWAIGAIVTGDSKKLQKFLVMYGDRGTGKSTIINIIEQLFKGYCTTFVSKALGSSKDSFAMSPFKDNPLVAIEHEGNLSKIEDNSKLNAIVSHDSVVINEKFEKAYSQKLNTFIVIASNKPVKITDSKSGLLRRLIDVTPTGNKIPAERYLYLTNNIQFELGAIAKHCKDVYLDMGFRYYDNYVPKLMLGETNDMYNFLEDMYDELVREDGITMKSLWARYKEYCQEANVPYPFSYRVFKTEVRPYFTDSYERKRLEDGTQVRNYLSGFKAEKFDYIFQKEESEKEKGAKNNFWLEFGEYESVFDEEFIDCPAQYGSGKDEKPMKSWDDVELVLGDLDTTRLHYVRVPLYLICVDFDIKDPVTGKKSLELNIEAASKWKATYAELSKSGGGIHLYYIYEGDVEALERNYGDDIEIKVFTGKSSLRRRLTKCNNLPIAKISSGLPKKEVRKTVSKKTIEDEKHLVNKINMALRKEVSPGKTVTCVNYIYDTLEEAYNSGMHYDVTALKGKILGFAMGSTNHSQECVDRVANMRFCSDDVSEPVEASSDLLVFFDVEVFKNLFVIVWKAQDKNHKPVIMINPKPEEVEALFDFRLVGFNNRKYDNHILWAAMMGYNNLQLYHLSQNIIGNVDGACFREAYNLSYADIYDFSSKKQSLKKWEIELKIHHEELGLKWDQEVPPELWDKVAQYCVYDVLATEAVFDACHGDYTARQILAELSGLKVNDTNRAHITKILVGNDKNPKHVYTDLSIIFPGYKMEWVNGKKCNMYRGTDVGFGGYVYAEPGAYTNVALLDVGNMHGASILALNKFGEHTKNYKEIRDARMAIKSGDFDKAKTMLGGKLAKYLTNPEEADQLQTALKLVLNSTYGIAAATFPNPLRDDRDVNNIIALRGALFMRTLQDEVAERGFTVAHIKTDSIKIPDATPEIIEFVMEFGRKYGYEFEHEATYEKMCLVNNAVYVAKYATPEWCEEAYGYIPKDCKKHPGQWTATGTQFQVPYVFKTLFSHEPIIFDDMCETKSVKTAIYLDFAEDKFDVSQWEDLKAFREISPEKRTRKQDKLVELYKDISDQELDDMIAEGHNYIFIGRVGRFCPMVKGCGAGYLLRESDTGFSAVTGSKGYMWMEAESVEKLGLQDKIDKSYYISLVDEAIKSISEYTDIEWFLDSDVEDAVA